MNIEKPAKGYITQYFNTPVDYIAGRSYHEALDIVNDNFTNIYSMFDGYVILVVDDVPDYAQTSPTNYSGYGNEVWIVSNNGKVKQRVAHLKKGAKVKEGQKVKQDIVIGVMGQTGYRFPLPTIHTHYEIYVDNVRVDPLGNWQKYLYVLYVDVIYVFFIARRIELSYCGRRYCLMYIYYIIVCTSSILVIHRLYTFTISSCITD